MKSKQTQAHYYLNQFFFLITRWINFADFIGKVAQDSPLSVLVLFVGFIYFYMYMWEPTYMYGYHVHAWYL